MSGTLKKTTGFSLPEVLVSLTLFAIVSMALTGYQSALRQGFSSQWHSLQQWRIAASQLEPGAPEVPNGWQVTRREISQDTCVSVMVTVHGASARQIQLSRLYCPSSVR